MIIVLVDDLDQFLDLFRSTRYLDVDLETELLLDHHLELFLRDPARGARTAAERLECLHYPP